MTKKGWVVNQINQTYFLKGLRMKKSVCLMAVLGALAASGAMAASTQSVDITFKGEVIDKACTISLHNGSNTLPLGTISTQIGDNERGTLVPMILKFSECKNVAQPNTPQAMTVNKVELVADLNDSNADLTNLSKGTLSTTKDGVLVQIYKNKTGTTDNDKGLVDGMKPTVADKVSLVTVGYVAMTKKQGAKLSAGDVEARAMFKVTYQ